MVFLGSGCGDPVKYVESKQAIEISMPVLRSRTQLQVLGFNKGKELSSMAAGLLRPLFHIY